MTGSAVAIGHLRREMRPMVRLAVPVVVAELGWKVCAGLAAGVMAGWSLGRALSGPPRPLHGRTALLGLAAMAARVARSRYEGTSRRNAHNEDVDGWSAADVPVLMSRASLHRATWTRFLSSAKSIRSTSTFGATFSRHQIFHQLF